MHATSGEAAKIAVRKTLMLGGEMLWIAGVCGARLLAIALLLSADGVVAAWAVALWVCVEVAAFNLTLLLEGSWHFYAPNVPVTVSVVTNVVGWLLTTTAPSLIISKPLFLGTRVFWAWTTWGIVSTVAGIMLALNRFASDDFQCGGGGTDFGDAAAGFGNATFPPDSSSALPTSPFVALDFCDAATTWTTVAVLYGVALLGLLAFLSSAVNPRWFSPNRRGYQNFKQHVTQFYWEENTNPDWGPSLDDHRANVLFWHHRSYWPPRLVVCAWFSERWPTWCDPATRPVWFVREWREAFPPAWLPDNDDVADDGVTAYDGKLNDLEGWLQENERL